MQDEERLVELAQKRDAEAFGQLYDEHFDRIYRYLLLKTSVQAEAEDLTQQVFLKAWDAIDSYKAKGMPFSSWLYRIAHNLVANWHRDHSRRQIVSLDRLVIVGPQGDDGPFQQVAQGERRDALLEAIRRLPADRQQLLILKFVERMPNAQIGQTMGRSEGAIKSLYHRTLVALRQELASQAG